MDDEEVVVLDEYRDFAVTTAKQIVNEETERLYEECQEDLKNLMQSWAERLDDRINARMEALGIAQELAIMVTWEPENMPVFTFTGATDVGVRSE